MAIIFQLIEDEGEYILVLRVEKGKESLFFSEEELVRKSKYIKKIRILIYYHECGYNLDRDSYRRILKIINLVIASRNFLEDKLLSLLEIQFYAEYEPKISKQQAYIELDKSLIKFILKNVEEVTMGNFLTNNRVKAIAEEVVNKSTALKKMNISFNKQPHGGNYFDIKDYLSIGDMWVALSANMHNHSINSFTVKNAYSRNLNGLIDFCKKFKPLKMLAVYNFRIYQYHIFQILDALKNCLSFEELDFIFYNSSSYDDSAGVYYRLFSELKCLQRLRIYITDTLAGDGIIRAITERNNITKIDLNGFDCLPLLRNINKGLNFRNIKELRFCVNFFSINKVYKYLSLIIAQTKTIEKIFTYYNVEEMHEKHKKHNEIFLYCVNTSLIKKLVNALIINDSIKTLVLDLNPCYRNYQIHLTRLIDFAFAKNIKMKIEYLSLLRYKLYYSKTNYDKILEKDVYYELTLK